MTVGARRQRSVFLNVPFDRRYERQFLALISSVVALGRTPRCVLELPDAGQGRLERLMKHIGDCAASIHELSRVGTPVRFNMPFELGLALAIARLGRQKHSFFVLDSKPYRLDRVLSDLKGYDPVIHKGTLLGTISAVCNVLRQPGGSVNPRAILPVYKRLRAVSTELKKSHGESTVYTRPIFEELVIAASKLARARGLLSA
jgi:hypothetical protein